METAASKQARIEDWVDLTPGSSRVRRLLFGVAIALVAFFLMGAVVLIGRFLESGPDVRLAIVAALMLFGAVVVLPQAIPQLREMPSGILILSSTIRLRFRSGRTIDFPATDSAKAVALMRRWDSGLSRTPTERYFLTIMAARSREGDLEQRGPSVPISQEVFRLVGRLAVERHGVPQTREVVRSGRAVGEFCILGTWGLSPEPPQVQTI